MTERLYYSQPYLTEFDAQVVAVEAGQAGTRSIVMLDRTAFYPTSGGQPFDTGTLGTARVVDVIDRDDGTIEHVIEGTIAQGRAVRGRIDWARRFDHMQQHTGQHLLSAAFVRVAGAKTIGFHLGATGSTIDLDGDPGADRIGRVEIEANRIVWEDRPVRIRTVRAAEAAGLPLRRDPKREGDLRVIEIDGYAVSACGGTHVSATGAIGLIAVARTERYKGGLRVEFLCGGRALGAYRAQRDIIGDLARQLSMLPHEVPTAVARLLADQRELRKVARLLHECTASEQAARLAAGAPVVNGVRVVVQAIVGGDAPTLRALASTIITQPGFRVALFSDSSPTLVVVARSTDSQLNATAVLRALTQQFGGRGGGNPDLAQGGGLSGDLPTILDRARELLTMNPQEPRSAQDVTK